MSAHAWHGHCDIARGKTNSPTATMEDNTQNKISTDDFQIRHYHHSELSTQQYAELAAVSRAAFAEHKVRGINMRDTEITPEEMRQNLCNHNDTVFIIYHGERMVGYARGSIAACAGQTALLAEGLATLPEYRGQSLGRRLVRVMEDWALSHGAQFARLDTSDKAVRIKSYHHSCGYKDWYYEHLPNRNYISIYMRKDYGQPYPPFKRLARLWTSWIKAHARYTRHGKNRLPFRAYGYLCGKLGIRAGL